MAPFDRNERRGPKTFRGTFPAVNDSATAIAAFSGEIDFTARERFRAQLAELREAGTVIVDLTDVTYMDSSALAELLFLQRSRSRQGRSVPRVVIGPRITRLFEVAGMQSVMLAFTTVDEARKA